MATKAPVIGIDLGTTNSCVGVFLNGKVEIIQNEWGSKTMPSMISFTDIERLFGKTAKDESTMDPVNTLFDIKRLIGRKFEDVSVQEDMKQWPFKVINKNGLPKLQVEYKKERKIFSPVEISAMILMKMKETAETYLGQKVTKAVVTVPAYFNDAQRHATKEAGTLADLTVLQVLNEPTAAALAYGLTTISKGHERNILVYDLGGGTFDVSILTIDGLSLEVKSTAGNTHLGGEDFNSRMVDHFAQEFETKHGKDLRTNMKSLCRLRKACEEAKKTLSSSNLATVCLDVLFDGIDFRSTITRARFDELNADLFEETLTLIDKALKDASLTSSQINNIVLVGGSTRIPKIQQILRDYFKRMNLDMTVNPDEAVAYGAAVHAAVLNDDKSAEIDKVCLLDVTPISLGVETEGGFMDFLIRRNTHTPIYHVKNYTTTQDNQAEVLIKVYEGEHLMTASNNLLGTFKLTKLTPLPRFQQKIEVEFGVNCSGIINVTAVEKLTGKENKITITNDTNRLTKEEIERMINELNSFKADEDKQRDRDSAMVKLEEFCFEKIKLVRNTNIGIPEEDRETISSKCNDVLRWIDQNRSTEIERFEEKRMELESLIKPILTKLDAGSTSTVPAPESSELDKMIDLVD